MGGRELGLTRGLSSARKFFENLIFSEAEYQGQKQNIGDWVGVFERAIVGSRRSGGEMCENRRPGILCARGARKFSENMDFLKHKTRDKIRIPGTGGVFERTIVGSEQSGSEM